jgi:hypothetical protein
MLAVSLGTHMARLCFGSFEHPRAGAFRRVFNARRRLREVPTVVPRCSKKVPTRVPSHLPATARYCTERAQKSVATISDPFGACAIEAIETQWLRKAEGTGPEPATPLRGTTFPEWRQFPTKRSIAAPAFKKTDRLCSYRARFPQNVGALGTEIVRQETPGNLPLALRRPASMRGLMTFLTTIPGQGVNDCCCLYHGLREIRQSPSSHFYRRPLNLVTRSSASNNTSLQ